MTIFVMRRFFEFFCADRRVFDLNACGSFVDVTIIYLCGYKTGYILLSFQYFFKKCKTFCILLSLNIKLFIFEGAKGTFSAFWELSITKNLPIRLNREVFILLYYIQLNFLKFASLIASKWRERTRRNASQVAAHARSQHSLL